MNNSINDMPAMDLSLSKMAIGSASKRQRCLSSQHDLPRTARLNVLIVEDNLINQKVLARSVTKLGHNVMVAGHGKEALQYISKTSSWNDGPAQGACHLDIVFSDLEMPEQDGLGFVAEVRRLQREGIIRGHLPVVAITGNARAEQVNLAMKAGMVSLGSMHVRA